MHKMLALATAFSLCAAPAFADNFGKDQTAMLQKKTDYFFNKIDTNGDGYISKEEHEQFANDMFAKADSNGDGKITKSELLAAKKAEHAEMKERM